MIDPAARPRPWVTHPSAAIANATGAAAAWPGRPKASDESGRRYIMPSVFGSQIDSGGQ